MHNDNELSSFLRAANSAPVLSREDEFALHRRWSAGRDPLALQALINSNLRHVVAIARRYRRYKLPLAELVSEGNLGLLQALDKFNPDLNNRFVTYASFWIRARIVNFVLRSWSIVGTGSGALRSKMFFKLRRERARYVAMTGSSEIAVSRLAEKFGISRKRIANMLHHLDGTDVSLNAPAYADSSTSMMETLPDDTSTQEHGLVANERQSKISELVHIALEDLDRRERFIIENRVMADTEEELSLAEIGRRLGISRERARQLESRARQKLAHRIRRQLARTGQNPSDLLTAA